MTMLDYIKIDYRSTGAIFKLQEYNNNNERHGISIWWNKHGKPWYETHYINDKRHGVHRVWNSDGILTELSYHYHGKDITAEVMYIVDDLHNITEHEKTLIALELGIVI